MLNFSSFAKKLTLLTAVGLMTFSNSGCFFYGGKLIGGFLNVSWELAQLWQRSPLIPVSAYQSERIEDAYHEEERYGRIPVLDPVEGENAPLFCLDPPTPDEVIRALPDHVSGGVAFLSETHRNNVRMVVEPIVDRIDECKFYPMVGPARLHHCHYKCTVYYDKIIRSSWPIPFEHTDEVEDVVYIDHDHLIRCAGPAAP